ncbi:MAG: FUSC family protein, partial [Oceanospirillaceae bacterium]|nr:FUSC family protein [Oceanospirillaceae bacterium]
ALAPFLLIGCLAMAERDKVIIGTDFGAVFLLLTAPDWPLQIDAMAFLHLAPGPTLGALTAAAGFYFILPTGPQRRLRDIEKLIEGDLRRLSRPGRELSEAKWRTRALHRALKLVLRTSAVGQPERRPVYGAIMAMNLGVDLLALNRQLDALPADDVYRRTITEVLAGLADETLPFEQAGDRLLSLAVEVVHQPGRAKLADLLQRCGLVLQSLPWR